MEPLLDTLGRCKLFRDLSPEVLEEAVIPRGRSRDIPRGGYLFFQQDRVDWFSVICSGRVHILRLSPEGNMTILSTLEPPELVGVDLVCTRSRVAPYAALAAEPVRVFSLPGALVLERDMGPWQFEVRSRLLSLLSHDNMRKEYRLAILSQRGLRERIWTYLTMQADKRGTDTLTIPFSREELASFLCVNRTALSHELSRMEQEGLIRFHKNVFTLLNRTPGGGNKSS